MTILNSSLTGLHVRIVQPSDKFKISLIHKTIEFVLKYGPQFEMELILREQSKNNSKYSFLWETTSEDHCYYRWKMYSLHVGFTFDRWSTEPFPLFQKGSIWFPPILNFVEPKEYIDHPVVDYSESDSDIDSSDDSDSNSDSEVKSHQSNQSEDIHQRRRKGVLTETKRKKLIVWLQNITSERRYIGDLMYFCILHSNSANSILDIIVSSIVSSQSEIPMKLSRFHLLSDLLYNSQSSHPNAWKYRSSLEPRLQSILVHFGILWKQIKSRMKAEQMRKSIMACLSAWETWAVFPGTFIHDLRISFMDQITEKETEKERKVKPIRVVETVPKLEEINIPLKIDKSFSTKFKPIKVVEGDEIKPSSFHRNAFKPIDSNPIELSDTSNPMFSTNDESAHISSPSITTIANETTTKSIPATTRLYHHTSIPEVPKSPPSQLDFPDSIPIKRVGLNTKRKILTTKPNMGMFKVGLKLSPSRFQSAIPSKPITVPNSIQILKTTEQIMNESVKDVEGVVIEDKESDEDEDEDVDGELMTDEDVDGEPMTDDDCDGSIMSDTELATIHDQSDVNESVDHS
ncbi:U2 snRNP-associated SURP domain-containing protein, partial [Globomyces sp. JEL0801]